MIEFMSCQYCGKPATVIGVFIKEVETRIEPTYSPISINLSTVYNTPIQTRVRVLAKTELVGFCDDHDHNEFNISYYLKCRITPEVKKEIEKVIKVQQDDIKNNRSVRIE